MPPSWVSVTSAELQQTRCSAEAQAAMSMKSKEMEEMETVTKSIRTRGERSQNGGKEINWKKGVRGFFFFLPRPSTGLSGGYNA